MEVNPLLAIGTAIVGLIGAITLALRAWLPGYLETVKQRAIDEHKAEIEAAAYERNREAFLQDKTFDMLEGTLEWLRQEHDKDRLEAQQERDLQRQLIATMETLGRSISRNTDIIRILAQGSAKLDDRLGVIEARLQRNDTRKFDGEAI